MCEWQPVKWVIRFYLITVQEIIVAHSLSCGASCHQPYGNTQTSIKHCCSYLFTVDCDLNSLNHGIILGKHQSPKNNDLIINHYVRNNICRISSELLLLFWNFFSHFSILLLRVAFVGWKVATFGAGRDKPILLPAAFLNRLGFFYSYIFGVFIAP